MAGEADEALALIAEGALRLARLLADDIARIEARPLADADEAEATRRVKAIEAVARAGRAIAMMRLAADRADKAVREAQGAARPRTRPAPANDMDDTEMDEQLTPDQLAELEREYHRRLDSIAAILERKRARRSADLEEGDDRSLSGGGV
jgi:hypothetical protein